SWDDYVHAEYGDLLLKFYASGLRDQRALSWVNLYYYGGGFDLLAALAAKRLPFTLFESRRLLGATVGFLGLFITWRIGRRVAGSSAGLIALILLASCPLYYGHMFMNPKDSPFAVAMAIFLLGLVRCFEEYPRVSIASAAITGAGFGLSFGSRIMGVFGVLDALAALALIFMFECYARGIRSAGGRLGQFVLPPLAVLGGLAGSFLVNAAARQFRPAPIAAAGLLAVGTAMPVAEMVRLHPYEYTDFNLLSGGVVRARDRYMLDYWGLSFK